MEFTEQYRIYSELSSATPFDSLALNIIFFALLTFGLSPLIIIVSTELKEYLKARATRMKEAKESKYEIPCDISIELDELRKLTVSKIPVHRDKIRDKLRDFGVDRLTELHPLYYADFKKFLTKL